MLSNRFNRHLNLLFANRFKRMSTEFNASISVTELLMKTLENCAKELAQRCIREASKRHGFDADEEIRLLGLENLSVIRKQMVKTNKKPEEKPTKDKKDKKEPKVKASPTIKHSFPLPFIKERVNQDGCQGLTYNRGLFTQCLKNRMENGSYCKGCQSETDNNASGCPECGTVENRLAAGLYAFKDPKGRSPVFYVKVLNKLKLTTDFVVEEAGKLNIIIPNEHFVDEQVKSTSSRGRPKKVSVVEVDSVTDLFAKLTCEANYDDVLDELLEDDNKSEKSGKSVISDISDNSDNSDNNSEKSEKIEKSKSKKLTEEEKEIKKAEREQKLLAEKEVKEAKRIAGIAEKEAQKEAKRLAEIAEKEKKIAEKEAKRLAEIAEKEAQKEAKRLAEIAEKEAKRLAEKEAKEKKIVEKEAQKEAKRLAEKEAKEKKETEKSKKKSDKVETKVESKEETKVETKEEIKEPPTKVNVTKIQIDGKLYLKSSVNILYDPETKEEVGLWNPETKTIEELPEEDEEEEEDEYDTDNE